MKKSILITLVIITGGFFLIFLLNYEGFAYKKRITGKYFLIAVDTKEDINICYRDEHGMYVGRIPGKPIEYGFNDTFLVSKSLTFPDSSWTYYIIDMTKDSYYAHEEDFRVGPISQNSYDSIWKRRLLIKMNKIE